MSFPSLPGQGFGGGGSEDGNMSGMSDQEKAIVKTVGFVLEETFTH